MRLFPATTHLMMFTLTTACSSTPSTDASVPSPPEEDTHPDEPEIPHPAGLEDWNFLSCDDYPGPDISKLRGTFDLPGFFALSRRPYQGDLWHDYGDMCFGASTSAASSTRDDAVAQMATSDTAWPPPWSGGLSWDTGAPYVQDGFVRIDCIDGARVASIPEADLHTWLGDVDNIHEVVMHLRHFTGDFPTHPDYDTREAPCGLYWRGTAYGYEAITQDLSSGESVLRIRRVTLDGRIETVE